MQIGVKMDKIQNCFQYQEALVFRTARRLMDGHVYVPEKCFE
jgi:2-methylaconitate cis-trans-isomerase PrpF